MTRKLSVADKLGSEVITYGGFAMRRTSAYLLAQYEGNDAATCDMVAFGPQTEVTDAPPMTVAQVIRWVAVAEDEIAAREKEITK